MQQGRWQLTLARPRRVYVTTGKLAASDNLFVFVSSQQKKCREEVCKSSARRRDQKNSGGCLPPGFGVPRWAEPPRFGVLVLGLRQTSILVLFYFINKKQVKAVLRSIAIATAI